MGLGWAVKGHVMVRPLCPSRPVPLAQPRDALGAGLRRVTKGYAGRLGVVGRQGGAGLARGWRGAAHRVYILPSGGCGAICPLCSAEQLQPPHGLLLDPGLDSGAAARLAAARPHRRLGEGGRHQGAPTP